MTIRRLALAAALLAATPLAFAQSSPQTANMPVTITVTNTCTVAAGTLAFGTQTLAAAADASANITVTCSNRGAYTLAFGDGNFVNGGQRRMEHTDAGITQHINYDLFSDAGRTTALTTLGGTSTGGGTGDVRTIFGRVPSGQANKETGNYADSVVVTLTF